jgi:TetR/AcrR family transcriptional regulator, transcriptional repressor for nem operon
MLCCLGRPSQAQMPKALRKKTKRPEAATAAAQTPNPTRQKLLEAAMYLFWEKGYNATGMAEVLSRAKAQSGSFYYFFDGKEAVLEAVLDLYLESLDPIIIQPAFAATRDPIERIFAILAGYRKRVIGTNFQYGCPLGRLALEIDPMQRKAREKLAANFDAWCAAIERCLKDAATRLPASVSAKEISRMVLSVMEGAVMQSRMSASAEPFDASIKSLRHFFDALLAPSARRKPKS